MFQIVSDLHLEFMEEIQFSDLLIPSAPYLALVGDIGYPSHNNYRNFISYCSKHYDKVFVITGNHEYYDKNLTMVEVDALVNDICSQFENVYFLNNTEHILDNNTVVLGTTLWSYIPRRDEELISRCINDYVKIDTDDGKLTPRMSSRLHVQNLEWLTRMFNTYNDKTIVVLTHHGPSKNAIAPQFEGSPINPAFVNNLDYLFEKYTNIRLWMFGHTHASLEFKVGMCSFYANSRGYNSGGEPENKSYQKNLVCSYEVAHKN